MILFSVTHDIRSANPATQIRQIFGTAVQKIPMMVFQEADFVDAPEHIIRVILSFGQTVADLKPVYKRKAKTLRADWSGDTGTKE